MASGGGFSGGSRKVVARDIPRPSTSNQTVACNPWARSKALRSCGTLRGRRHDGLWIDVGTPERLAEIRAVVEGWIREQGVVL